MDTRTALGVDYSNREFVSALEDVEEYERLIALLVVRRKQKRLTQAQVAELLHTTQPVISELERLAGNPSITRLMEYARAVGLRLHLSVSASAELSDDADLEYASHS